MVDATRPRAVSEARPGRTQGITLNAGKLFERTTVIDSIVAEIKDKILSGELKNGDMLASQDELARALGVSRASLREALSRLSLMGLVETRHGSGTFVKTTKPLDFRNPLTSLLVMDQDSAAELLQARFYIESPVAELAALNATDEQVEQMGNLIERMRVAYATDDADGYVNRYFSIAFILASALAVLGGILYAPMTAVQPYMGFMILLLGLATVIVGGMGNLNGTFVSALPLGLVMAITGRFWSQAAETMVFIVMGIVLVFKPTETCGVSSK